MSQQELLISVLSVLNELQIEYMVTGSIVSSIQGEPRLTHDIDIVLAISNEDVLRLREAFPPPQFYLDSVAACEAIRNYSMFNLIDSVNGDKVDFWLLTKDEFDASRFSRKQCINFLGVKAFISAPEDTILAKLRWIKMSGGSSKQFTDALRVYELQYALLDLTYIEAWAEKLGLTGLWQETKQQGDPVVE